MFGLLFNPNIGKIKDRLKVDLKGTLIQLRHERKTKINMLCFRNTELLPTFK